MAIAYSGMHCSRSVDAPRQGLSKYLIAMRLSILNSMIITILYEALVMMLS